MAIEKPSETATHEGATVGYWLSETDAHRESFEKGRQAGYREGIESAAKCVQSCRWSEKLTGPHHDREIRGNRIQFLKDVLCTFILRLLPTDGQETPEP